MPRNPGDPDSTPGDGLQPRRFEVCWPLARHPSAGIPHDWHRHNPLARFEGFYASVFYSYLTALGHDVRVEDATNKGRIDLALRLPGRVYLFAFKVVELVPDGRAMAQLQARGYAEKYREPGVTVTLVGIEFSREQRNLVGFEVVGG